MAQGKADATGDCAMPDSASGKKGRVGFICKNLQACIVKNPEASEENKCNCSFKCLTESCLSLQANR